MYEIILTSLIILCFISLGIFLYFSYNIKTKSKEIIKEDIEKLRKQKKNEYDNIYNEYNIKTNNLRKEFEEKQNIYNKSIEQTKSIIQEEEEKKNLILNQKQEIINKELNEYKIKEENRINKELEIKINGLIEQYESFQDNIEASKNEYYNDLEKIKKELEDYRLRRSVINEAILREKEIQEKGTFYKINITENDIEDIEVLRTIESKLKNKEALNKLIFDVYISKPMKEMIKRVLNGKAPSGIYKITYLPTGESYIGKSTNLKNRWEQHCKSTFGLGTISHSSLHTKMARDGIWNFSFEMLEEVSKENLTEREKYYINFYDTVKFGMNEKVG